MAKFTRIAFITFIAVVSAIFVLFFLDNLEKTTISFLFWETVPLFKSLFLVIAFMLGMFTAFSGMMGWLWAQSRRIRSLEKERALMITELKAFRHKPLEESETFVTVPSVDAHTPPPPPHTPAATIETTTAIDTDTDTKETQED